VIAVEAVVRPVLDRRDSADHGPVAPGEEQLTIRVGVEGILHTIERVVHGRAKRRDPRRETLPVEQPTVQIDEAAKVAARRDGNDVEWYGERFGSAYARAREW